jgi:hypothetical protein
MAMIFALCSKGNIVKQIDLFTIVVTLMTNAFLNVLQTLCSILSAAGKEGIQ